MELIQISDNALKVMLTCEDMRSYDIAFETLDYTNTETRRAISEILAVAKRTVGFAADSEQLYIEAFSDGEGGCELFVRRERESVVYELCGVDMLLMACRRLCACGYCGDVFYAGGRDTYYVCLLRDAEFLCELAVKRTLPRGFFEEHTKRLCDIKTIAKM